MLLRIKELRQNAGLSQDSLAAEVNVNQTAVSQWEREAAFPSCEKLPDLAAALGCTIDDLFCKAASIISDGEG